MKKIILLLLLVPLSVNALTFSYEKDIITSDKLLNEGEELKLLKETKLYNTYSETKEDLGYLEYNNQYYIDKKDVLRVSNFKVSEKDNNSYQQISAGDKRISSFSIYTDEDYFISEIEVYQHDHKLDHFVDGSSIDCSKLRDKKYDEVINIKGNRIYIVFSEFISPDELEIIVTSNDLVEHTFTINYYREEDNTVIPDEVYTDYNSYYISTSVDENNSYHNDVSYKYRHYKKDKTPTGIYREDGNNLIYDDYIFKYYYQTYDVIYLSDDCYNLDNLVEYTNFKIDNFSIIYDNDIYFKSGSYDVDVYVNDYHMVLNYNVTYEDEESKKKDKYQYIELIISSNNKIPEEITNVEIEEPKVEFITKPVIGSNSNSNNQKVEYISSNITNDILQPLEPDLDENDIFDDVVNVIDETLTTTQKNDVVQTENNKYVIYCSVSILFLICILSFILYIRKKSKNVEDI